MKTIDPHDFQVRPGKSVSLHKWPTSSPPVYGSKKEYRKLLQDYTKELSDQQSLLYAF